MAACVGGWVWQCDGGWACQCDGGWHCVMCVCVMVGWCGSVMVGSTVWSCLVVPSVGIQQSLSD